MGMNLGQRSETWLGEDDRSWLGSAHGTDLGDSVTLDGANLVATYADGKIPSGEIVSRDSASGLYQLGTAGEEPGHLLEPVRIPDPSAPANPTAAIMWHGEVVVPNLPANAQFDTDTVPSIPTIRYLDVPAPTV